MDCREKKKYRWIKFCKLKKLMKIKIKKQFGKILLSVKTSCLWWWLPLTLSKRQSPLPTQSFSGLCSPLTIRLYYHRFSILRSFGKVWNRATSKFGTQAYLTQGLKSLTPPPPPSPLLGLLPKRFWNSSVRDDFDDESGQYNVLITGIHY